MKKIFSVAILTIAFGLTANAQTVITNDYGSQTSASSTQRFSDDDETEAFSWAGVSYYSFDGFENWGIDAHNVTPNGLGMDFGARINFEKNGNFNWDLGFNYSFGLWNNNDMNLLLTLAAGPSFRSQTVSEYNEKNGKIEEKSKFYIDCFINPRLSFKASKFVVTAGYYFWAPKFKFGKDYKADGFNVGVGYVF